jgi:PAS domain S-box-containing protein
MATEEGTRSDPALLDTILDSITEGVFTVGLDWTITFFNRAAEEITGIPREEALGRSCHDVFRASICEDGCCLRRSMESGEPNVHKAAYIIRHDGKRVPISIATAVIRDADGRISGGVETFRNLSDIETLHKELKKRYSYYDIISKNSQMHSLLDLLPQVARSGATVLIEGESGTGKELFARAIHNLSPRSQGPLITVNCGALPDSLLESELFGHVAGAFTDARTDHPGRFALADGGSIFLDEVGDVSAALQVRLLRVLQEKTFEPLGGTTTRKVDVRVIAATNRNLPTLVRKGMFREDLYYRIHVVNLKIPPLRERKEDIPLLVDHFVDHFNRLQGREVSGVAPETLAILMQHDYPGNVRELINLMEHAFVLCPGGILLPEHLPTPFKPAEGDTGGEGARNLKEFEAQLIRQALKRNGHNRARTARELGIHPTTLWRKMKKLGVE